MSFFSFSFGRGRIYALLSKCSNPVITRDLLIVQWRLLIRIEISHQRDVATSFGRWKFIQPDLIVHLLKKDFIA